MQSWAGFHACPVMIRCGCARRGFLAWLLTLRSTFHLGPQLASVVKLVMWWPARWCGSFLTLLVLSPRGRGITRLSVRAYRALVVVLCWIRLSFLRL
nr:MAG TPA: hypothetical protein [Caudoviricetes sp.]